MKTILAAAVALAAGFAALPSTASAGTVAVGEEHCVVDVRPDDPLALRAGPSAGAKRIGALDYGTCGVVVTGACKGGWCPVEANHAQGFVSRRYISMVSPALYCVSGVAKGDRLNVRAFPSPSSRVVTRLAPQACDIAFLPYATKGWQKIRVKGFNGWVRRNFVSGE